MNTSDTDSEESVIDTTPVKKKSCIFRKVKTKQAVTSKVECPENQNSNDKGKPGQYNQPRFLLDDLIREGNKLLEESQMGAPNNSESTEKDKAKLEPKETPLAEPIYTPNSKNPHNTYVYYLIEEILKFKPESTPKNCNLQLAGTVKFHNSSISHFLYALKDETNEVKIRISLKDCLILPQEGRTITAFGILAFENNLPYIVIKFFQPLHIKYHTFNTIMLTLRTALPLENWEMTNETEYFPDSFIESEEINDLVNTINLDSGKSSKEGDLSTFSDDSQFNDVYWNKVLDDISFEKLCSEASANVKK